MSSTSAVFMTGTILNLVRNGGTSMGLWEDI
jgi:hypothetical protein